MVASVSSHSFYSRSVKKLPVLSSVPAATTSMTEKFSQEIPPALQPEATDNRGPVPRSGPEPNQTAVVPEGPVWLSLADPALFMNGQISL